MGTFGLWLGSGAAALRRRRERSAVAVRAAEPERRQEHAELLARLRELESTRTGDDAGHGGHRRTQEVAAIIGSTRAAADPAVRALTSRAETVLRHALRDLCDAALGDGAGEGPAEPEDLDTSVRALAAAVPLPVRVTVDVGPLAPAVAATVYAVICESLANVVGHARARQVVVTVRRHGPTVQVAVSDDGDGGAQPVMGGGIVVLAARVAALGGLLHVDSPPGSGTHVTVELPART
ncbi:ATP-binding protein [Dactylosporangium sp. NPDC050688]|uniref:sensor histidine kinase n=1 Tax=Dactylosporangium sp. NPDC050688 TaxID=3157217 RepID=UPI0033FAEE71